MTLYNEIDPYAAKWLQELIGQGHIAIGEVDVRSICELKTAGPIFHAFAGVGVWSYALRLAGWPDDQSVWTGSCPCQPFSVAGRGRGTADKRHLWPEWLRLITKCRPPIIFGEQVASPDGRIWLSVVRADLEALGYAVGAADLCAAGVGAPHIRQRLFFGALADVQGLDVTRWEPNESREREVPTRGRCILGRVGDTDCDRREGSRIHLRRGRSLEGLPHSLGPSPTRGFWRDADWLACTDGKARPVEPGTFPLAHGAPARVGRLRGYGNAIVPQVAATFIQAFMESLT